MEEKLMEFIKAFEFLDDLNTNINVNTRLDIKRND